MSTKNKSRALYSHPFCKGYWRDAVAELKDIRMLVFAALIVALRVALKMVRIPLAPNLDITSAFLANALGAMVYGPVVGAIGAVVSDVLGVLLRGDTYFLPYVLTEISSTVIFALFFYRQKPTPTRAIVSRFSICLFINILMQTPIDMLFQLVFYGKSTVVLTLPRIFKNLFMFPIESVALTLFLSVIQPITYRMGLTYNSDTKLSFNKKQVALLVILVVVGIGSVFGYLFVHYQNTSLSSAYDSQERTEKNKYVQTVVLAESDDWDDLTTMTVVESAYKEFLGKEITYTVAVYEVADGVEVTEQMWGYSKTPASKDENLTKVATVTFVVNEKTGEVLSFIAKEVS
ncbi:MAG: folate family ECF transporter S component [Faecousia sp.]